MTTTRRTECSAVDAVLYVALELSARQWKLACTTGPGARVRLRTIPAEAWDRLGTELARAKAHFRVPATTPVRSCYEAGRDGFWIHRYLTSLGVTNVVVDSASIELPRRPRRAKTDRLDAVRLVGLLMRAHRGEPTWRVVRIPDAADEDRRQAVRELRAAQHDRTAVRNRIRGLLAAQGVRVGFRRDFLRWLAAARCWDGTPVGTGLQARLGREWAQLQATEARIDGLEHARSRAIRESAPAMAPVQRLRQLCGIGEPGAWTLGVEVFAWRQFANRREVGGFLGLTPTPSASGTVHREQGISKVGPPALRALLVQLAWQWRRHQPRSALAQWYEQRFGSGGPRARRIGIIALARRLWIALWRYATQGILPAGARLKAA
jgi:transposase